MNEYDIYQKAVKVIDSCKTTAQVMSARNYVKLTRSISNPDSTVFDGLDYLGLLYRLMDKQKAIAS